MPLDAPGSPGRYRRFPSRRLAGAALWRVHRRLRDSPWWFGSADASRAGRFDLPPPNGACYLATSKLAAVLEAFQGFGRGLVSQRDLVDRAAARVTAPDTAPRAANLSSRRALAFGVTAALWADRDRAMTQQWAFTLHRAGWRALHHGIQHDPSGHLRAVTLFDIAGEHPPDDDAQGWAHADESLHDDDQPLTQLAGYGIHAERGDVDLPIVDLDASGLLEEG